MALLFLALAAAVLVTQRRGIARWLLLGEIHRAGIEDASLVVATVSVDRLSLSDLRLGAPPALEIARIDARYSPASLWRGYLNELSVWGLRLRGSLGEDGLSLGALDALLEGDSGGAGGGLPARKVSVTDARVDLDAPGGAVVLPFQIDIDEVGGGRLQGEASFEIQHPLVKAAGGASIAGTPDDFEGTLRVLGSPLKTPNLRIGSVLQADASFRYRAKGLEARAELAPVPFAFASELLRAEGETPEIHLQLRRPGQDSAFELGVETRAGRLELPDYSLTAAEIGVSARVEEESGRGSLRIGSLQDLERPARVTPLALGGSFEIRDSSVGYHLTLSNPKESLVLEATGTADPVARSASAELRLQPLVFDPAGLQPAALFPLLEGQIEEARGSVEAVGTAAWDGVQSSARIDLALREIGFATGAAELSRLNGRIEIGGPFPPFTPPGQLVSIALIDVGLELTDGLIEFQLRPDGLLELKEAEWRWGGGVIRTAGLFDPMADSQEAVLEVEDVELAELLALVDLEGLEGTGVLEGEIPIVRDGDTVEIRDAELGGGPEGGVIRYRPVAGAKALAGQGYGVEQLLGALEDFRYDLLQLTVDGDTAGEIQVAAHLGGFNPNFQGGRRVEFHLNVEARLADLLRAELSAYRVPEVIEKRLEEFQAPEVK